MTSCRGIGQPSKELLGDFHPGAKEGITSAVNNFLSGVSWSDCSKFNVECVTNWTHLFAERDVTYEPSIIDNFISFVDYMSCSAEETWPRLTNKEERSVLLKQSKQCGWSDLQQIVPASRSQLLKCNKKRRIMKSFYCISKFITIFVVKI